MTEQNKHGGSRPGAGRKPKRITKMRSMRLTDSEYISVKKHVKALQKND